MTAAACVLESGADAELGRGDARCSIWWRRVPELAGERLGAIGAFSAASRTSAIDVLDEACRALQGRGCTLAVGPMDGSTWRRYRLLTERGDAPPFLLELDNPDAWPRWFRAAGFETLARYRSTVNAALDRPDKRLARAGERMAALGVRVRPIDVSRLPEELALAYRVARESFRKNFLYMPISQTEFLELTLGLGPLLREGLSALAFHGPDPVGLIFAMPDLLQKRRGEPETDYLIKTLAVAPGREYAGLGTVLMAHTRELARARGLTRAIHALMHDDNFSTNVSAGYSRLIRRYELLARRLG